MRPPAGSPGAGLYPHSKSGAWRVRVLGEKGGGEILRPLEVAEGEVGLENEGAGGRPPPCPTLSSFL